MWKRTMILCGVALVGALAVYPGAIQAREQGPEQERAAAGTKVPPAPGSIGKLHLGFVPFFGAENMLVPKKEEKLDGWFKTATLELLDEDIYNEVEPDWIEAQSVAGEVFEKLPKSRIRGVPDLLSSLLEGGREGVLASWVEARGESSELVVVLFLPDRIRLEGFRVSTNFERAPLEADQQGFEKDATRKLMRELVRRNLARVEPGAAAAASPVPAPAPAAVPEPTAGSPASTEPNPAPVAAPAPTPSPPPSGGGGGAGGGFSAVAGAGSRGIDARRPIVAVASFSKELPGSRPGAPSGPVRSLHGFPFAERSLAILGRTLGTDRAQWAKDPRPVTVDQVEAPVIDLDPMADPQSREKGLFARAGPGIDALVFGHLTPGRNASEMELRLRLLRGSDLQSFQTVAAWTGQQMPPNGMEQLLERKFRELLGTAGYLAAATTVGPGNEPGEPFHITVVQGESISQIARRCYGKESFSMELAYALCNHNGVLVCGHIEPGDRLFVPREIGRWTRRDSACRCR